MKALAKIRTDVVGSLLNDVNDVVVAGSPSEWARPTRQNIVEQIQFGREARAVDRFEGTEPGDVACNLLPHPGPTGVAGIAQALVGQLQRNARGRGQEAMKGAAPSHALDRHSGLQTFAYLGLPQQKNKGPRRLPATAGLTLALLSLSDYAAAWRGREPSSGCFWPSVPCWAL